MPFGELSDVRTVGGAKAINLLPRGGADKGVAVQQARRMFACDTVIYVGDDDTDEDAFASAPPDRLLSIRVGARGATQARYRLRLAARRRRLSRAADAPPPRDTTAAVACGWSQLVCCPDDHQRTTSSRLIDRNDAALNPNNAKHKM